MDERTKSWLLGCGFGCFGLIVLFVAAVIGLQRWAVAPSELPPRGILLKDDVSGYGRVELAAEDAELAALVAEVVAALSPQDAGQVGRSLEQGLPIRAELALRPETRDERAPRYTATISVSRYGNPMRLAFGLATQADQRRYREERIMVTRAPGQRPQLVSVPDRTIVIASSVEGAGLGIDAVLDEASAEPPELMATLLEDVGSERAPLLVYLGQPSQALAELGAVLARGPNARAWFEDGQELLKGASAALIVARFESLELAGSVLALYPDSERAQAAGAALEDAVVLLSDDPGRERTLASVRERLVRVDFTTTELVASLKQQLER